MSYSVTPDDLAALPVRVSFTFRKSKLSSCEIKVCSVSKEYAKFGPFFLLVNLTAMKSYTKENLPWIFCWSFHLFLCFSPQSLAIVCNKSLWKRNVIMSVQLKYPAISGEKPNIHPLQCDFFFKINIELESPIAPTFISSIMREYISVHSNCTYLPIKSMGTYSVVSHVFGSYLISYLQFF